jgi:hypothetical protein
MMLNSGFEHAGPGGVPSPFLQIAFAWCAALALNECAKRRHF